MKAKGNKRWRSARRTALKVNGFADMGQPERSRASGKAQVLFFWLWHYLASENEEVIRTPMVLSLFIINYGDWTL